VGAAPSRLSLFLLSCGIIAPLLYVVTDVLLTVRWDGYSYRDQTISELNAIGSPTRTLSIVLGIVGYAFVAAFGVGVWRLAVANRKLRVAAGGLVTLGVLGCFGVPFFPMHVREAEETLTDTLHVAQLAVAAPLLFLIIGFGAASLGWRFRLYSALTVLVMIAFGAWAGRYGADVANDLATPWVGIIERISVYAYQLWFAAFASALLGLALGRAGSWRIAGPAPA
jgi:putative Mn2+ efflux pump MntP